MACPAQQLRRFHLRKRQYCVLGVGYEKSIFLSGGGRFRGIDSRPANLVLQDVIDTAARAVLCRSVVGPTRPDPSPPLSGHLPTVGWDFFLSTRRLATFLSQRTLLWNGIGSLTSLDSSLTPVARPNAANVRQEQVLPTRRLCAANSAL